MTTAPDRVTAPVITILENAWAAIAKRHPDLPAVAFVIGSGTSTVKGGTWTAGHFAPARWADDHEDQFARHEIFVAGELLRRGPVAILSTMLHEAAHAIAHVRKVTDTSRGGRYHNARYAEIAMELGLEVTQVGTLGWSGTEATPDTLASYRPTMAKLGTITAHRRAESRAEATGRKSNNNGMALACPTCERKLRISRAAFDAGPVICWPCLEDAMGTEDGPGTDLAYELAALLGAATFEDAA